jgi:hypothetical protein
VADAVPLRLPRSLKEIRPRLTAGFGAPEISVDPVN